MGMRYVGPFALVVLLSACAGQPLPAADALAQTPAAAGRPSVTLAQAKQSLLRERSRMWKDPDSIRDATIGEPTACREQNGTSCVCIEVNAKNAYGGYTGIRRTIAVFSPAGGFDTLDAGIKGFQDYCGTLRPFPELNGRR